MSVGAALALGFAIFCFPSIGAQSDWIRACFAAMLLAYSQVGLQAWFLQTDWFLRWEDGKEGPLREHFLWICHRASFSPERFLSEDTESKAIQNVEEKLAKCEERVKQVAELDGKVDA